MSPANWRPLEHLLPRCIPMFTNKGFLRFRVAQLQDGATVLRVIKLPRFTLGTLISFNEIRHEQRRRSLPETFVELGRIDLAFARVTGITTAAQ